MAVCTVYIRLTVLLLGAFKYAGDNHCTRDNHCITYPTKEMQLSSEFERNLIPSEITPENGHLVTIESIFNVKKRLFDGDASLQRFQYAKKSDITPEDGQSIPLMPNGQSVRKRLGFGSTEYVNSDLGTALLDDAPTYATLTSVGHEGFRLLDELAIGTLDLNQNTTSVSFEAPLAQEIVIPASPVISSHENLNLSDDIEDILQVEEVLITGDNAEDTELAEVAEQNAVVQSGPTKSKRSRQAIPSASTPPRKRQRNPLLTKAAVAKVAYNSGLPHTTARGKERQARSLKPGCTGKCRKSCQAKFNEEARENLFKTYYSSGSKSAQWHMLAKYVKQIPVKRRVVLVDSPHRKHSYEYFLPDTANNLIPVCQTMFTHTFDISMSVVQSAIRKNSPDKREKHTIKRKRTSPILIQSVKDHIKSFPKIESHYCREDTKRQYLQENLNVSKMYRLYILGRGQKTPNTATLRQYQDIFNNCFNLGFYKPKKDQCSLCFRWNAIPEEERENHLDLLKEYTEHMEAKVLVRNCRKEIKTLSRMDDNKKRIKVICFDLQKVFFCPKSEVGDFFYKRKISCYNFTIFDCTLKTATCFVWDMTIAGRGAAEILSCVYMYIEKEVGNGLEELHVYSDSCWSQNKNKFLFSMYSMLSRKHNIKIVHRYLQKGHTQMECDSVHARIEKKTRNNDIFTPQEWYGFIITAKVQKPMYAVVQVKQNNILSFKNVAENNFLWDRVPVSKIHEIIFDPATPGKIKYKKKLSDEGISFEVLSKKRGRPVNWETFKPPKKYSGPLRLKPKLVKDLKWMIDKKLIPDRALPFYLSVTSPDFGVLHHEDTANENDYAEEIPNINVESILNSEEEETVDTPENVHTEATAEEDAGSGSEMYD